MRPGEELDKEELREMRLGKRGMGIMELAGPRTCFAGTGGRTELGKLRDTGHSEGKVPGPSLQAPLPLREHSEQELNHIPICPCSAAALSVVPD